MSIQVSGAGGGTAAADVGAQVIAAAAQSINNNTATALTFSSEVYDTDAIADLGAQATRLTCKTAGKYHIEVHCEFAANATGIRIAWLYIGGVNQNEGVTLNSAGAGVAVWASASFIRDMDEDDYAEIDVYQTSGGPLNVTNKRFSMQLLAAT